MSPRVLLAGGLLAILLLGAAGGLLLSGMQRETRLRQRLLAARGEVRAAVRAPRPRASDVALSLVARIGGAIARSRLLPAATLAELEQTLALAGLRGANGLGAFIGAKLLLAVTLPFAAVMLSREFALSPALARPAPIIAAVIGLLLPDKIVSSRRETYRAKLESGVPDALDLMVICTQSGLGLAPTMQRVATEIAHAHPAIARELAQTVTELQIAVSVPAALTALGTRTGLDSLRRVATTLIQTIQYGTPLSAALRSLAAEMREESLTRYEAKAARLPVMLTIPMIIFVLPCIFIVVGGPAALHIMKAFQH